MSNILPPLFDLPIVFSFFILGCSRDSTKVLAAKQQFWVLKDFSDYGSAIIYDESAYGKQAMIKLVGPPKECGQTEIDRRAVELPCGDYFAETCVWEIESVPIGSIVYIYSGNNTADDHLGIRNVESAFEEMFEMPTIRLKAD